MNELPQMDIYINTHVHGDSKQNKTKKKNSRKSRAHLDDPASQSNAGVRYNPNTIGDVYYFLLWLDGEVLVSSYCH